MVTNPALTAALIEGHRGRGIEDNVCRVAPFLFRRAIHTNPQASGPFIEGCPEPSLGNCVVGNYGPFVSVRAALLFSSWQMAMAGIARNIELYNSAYRLAWKYVSAVQKRDMPNIAWRLHDFIRREIKKGASEPLLIASEALRSVEFNPETWD